MALCIKANRWQFWEKWKLWEDTLISKKTTHEEWTKEEKATLTPLQTQLLSLKDTALCQVKKQQKKDMITSYK